jgi:putative transposase
LGGGQPDIHNSDQGAQFTSEGYLAPLKERGVAISMDGKGRCLDNIFVERLWRTVKYEDVYIKGYSTLKEVRAGITDFFHFYNNERPHQSLDNQFPSTVYYQRNH